MAGLTTKQKTKFGQCIKYFIFSTCFVFMVNGVVLFILDVAKNPIGTITHSFPSADLNFDQLLVCISGWSGKKEDPSNFPLGHTGYITTKYLPPRDHPDIQEMNWNWTKNSTTYEDWLQNVQYLYDMREKTNKEKLTVEPRFTKGYMGCGKVPRFNSSHYQLLEEDTIQADIFIFYFTVPRGKTRKAMFTLLMPESIQPLGYEDFFNTKYSSSRRDAYRTYTNIMARVTKNKYISTHDHPCTQPPEGATMSPVGYLQKKCNLRCALEAHGRLQNCTPLLLLNETSTNFNYPLCHQQIVERSSEEMKQGFRKMKADCVQRAQCHKKRYCTEWDTDMVLTRATDYSDRKAFSDRTLHKVTFTLYPRLSFIEEYRIYTRESILGNVGGLMGLWVGLSAYGICEFVLAILGLDCCTRKDSTVDVKQ